MIQAWKNIFYYHLADNNQIWSQFCTCHDSSAVVTCAKVWSDWIVRIITKVRREFTQDFNHELKNPLLNGSLAPSWWALVVVEAFTLPSASLHNTVARLIMTGANNKLRTKQTHYTLKLWGLLGTSKRVNAECLWFPQRSECTNPSQKVG